MNPKLPDGWEVEPLPEGWEEEAPQETAPPSYGDEPGRKIGEPTDRERRWGQIVSFMSGSPLFGTVSKAADSLTGQTSQKSAQRATDQFSPKVAGVPVLPVLGGMVATAPAGAASIAPRAGAALLGGRAAMGARVGLQGGLGAVQAADQGGGAGDVALGAGAGLAGGALGDGAGVGLSRLGQAARPFADRVASSQAVKALLGGGTMVNRLKSMGVTDDASLQSLGKDVRELGVLTNRVGFPRNAQGINEGVEGVLAAEGSEIGRVRKLADEYVTAGKAPAPNAVEASQAFEQSAKDAAKYASHTDNLGPVLEQGQSIVRQATPPLGGQPTTLGGSYEGLWGQTSRMAQSAYKPGDAIGDALAKRELSQAGVRGARQNLSKQMEGAVGPDEMDNLQDAMKRYSTAARVSDVTADTAGRSVAKNTFGLGDNALVQTMGLTGPAAAAALPLMSLVRSRGNAAVARYLPTAANAAAPGLGIAGAGARLGTPAAARESISDPMGPLRQYLGLSPEERNEANADAFTRAP